VGFQVVPAVCRSERISRGAQDFEAFAGLDWRGKPPIKASEGALWESAGCAVEALAHPASARAGGPLPAEWRFLLDEAHRDAKGGAAETARGQSADAGAEEDELVVVFEGDERPLLSASAAHASAYPHPPTPEPEAHAAAQSVRVRGVYEGGASGACKDWAWGHPALQPRQAGPAQRVRQRVETRPVSAGAGAHAHAAARKDAWGSVGRGDRPAGHAGTAQCRMGWLLDSVADAEPAADWCDPLSAQAPSRVRPERKPLAEKASQCSRAPRRTYF